MKKLAVLFFTVLCIAGILTAQQPPSKLLRLSPYASVTQTIGITEVSVTYHRPSVKGRDIWNKLVPFGQVWRAGANNATLFSFSDDVTINGTALKAGKYEFFLVPSDNEWTVIFNSATDQWGAFSYDSTRNVLKFNVKPEGAAHEEFLSYSFSDLSLTSAKVSLRWEKLSVSFVISTNTMENIGKTDAFYTSQAAQLEALVGRLSFDSKTDYDRGIQAYDRANALNPSYSNYSYKAQILALQEKYDDAVKTGEQGIEFGKKNGANTGGLEKMVAEWKTKLPPTKGKKK